MTRAVTWRSSRSVNATRRQEGTQKHSPQLLAPPQSTRRRLFLKRVHVYAPTSARALTDAAATAAATRRLQPGPEPGALGLPHLTKASSALTLTTSMLSPAPGAGVPPRQSPEANAANASILPSERPREGWLDSTHTTRSVLPGAALARCHCPWDRTDRVKAALAALKSQELGPQGPNPPPVTQPMEESLFPTF